MSVPVIPVLKDAAPPPFTECDMLDALHKARALEAIDVQLARLCVRRSDEGEGAMALALATAMASKARREGHSALTLSQLAHQGREAMAVVAKAMATQGLASDVLPAGDAAWWRATVAASALVSDGSTFAPLVLQGDVLQFRRYYDAELRIARKVHELAHTAVAAGDSAFAIISGGPGTGKTTLVADQLLELAATNPGLRVALAAPTGKAAARLTESIRQRLDAQARSTGRRADFPGEARTLHRLLGYSPQNDTFRRNQDDPLDEDLVIVDEASMVDVLLLDAVLRALKPGARLMLVGDHDQLSSVDAGDVLGVLYRSASALGERDPFRKSITRLDKSWRFLDHPAIGTLARAILGGDAEGVLQVCADESTPDVQLRPTAPSTDALVEPIVPNLDACLAATTPAALLAALDTFRVLAPEREGRLGVRGINAAVERWLSRHGQAVNELWYHRRPVLVTANDYGIGVFNGDVGVAWREEGRVTVYFRANDGSLRGFSPARLPASETAWAMTVHKSQGSEFDNVLVVIPEGQNRVMSRELLYTAVTRAREGVTIVGSAAALRTALARRVDRTTGLEGRLREVISASSNPMTTA